MKGDTSRPKEHTSDDDAGPAPCPDDGRLNGPLIHAERFKATFQTITDVCCKRSSMLITVSILVHVLQSGARSLSPAPSSRRARAHHELSLAIGPSSESYATEPCDEGVRAGREQEKLTVSACLALGHCHAPPPRLTLRDRGTGAIVYKCLG
jgi:hypothetical protein